MSPSATLSSTNDWPRQRRADLREPDRAHEAHAVEEHGEREAQDRRHPEYGSDRRTQEVEAAALVHITGM